MEFRLEEPGISVKSVGVATAAEPQVVPLEDWFDAGCATVPTNETAGFACL